jgi:hypothetical protein
MNSETVYTLIPVETSTLIKPGDDPNVPEKCSAIFSLKQNKLTVYATILIPDDTTISIVTLKQFYSKDVGLQFYFVYSVSNPKFIQKNYVSCKFNALPKDASGNQIPLSNLKSILQLIQDTDPKTSRGTTTPITHNTDV